MNNSFDTDFYGNDEPMSEAEFKKEQRKDKVKKVVGRIILIAIVLTVGVEMINHRQEQKAIRAEERRIEAAERAERRAHREMVIQMQTQTDRVARTYANFPQTVEWGDHDRFAENDDTYVVVRSYTAANAFGVRSEYTVQATFDKTTEQMIEHMAY